MNDEVHGVIGFWRIVTSINLKAGLGFLTQRRQGAEDAEFRSHGGPENVHLLGEPVVQRIFFHSSALSAALRLCVFHPIAVSRIKRPAPSARTAALRLSGDRRALATDSPLSSHSSLFRDERRMSGTFAARKLRSVA
jgi:hypothetical protein